jgi:transcriptional regulator with XRE-family HTH domain
MDVSKAVQKNIPILLARTSMSQATLAAKSKLSKTSIQRITNGDVSPTLHTLQALADGFGVSPATLIEAGLDRKSLTGVKKVDTAISAIYPNLYRGADILKTIGKYFAADYRLVYGDQLLTSPTRTGPTIKEELISNQCRDGHPPIITIKAAWLTGDQVLINLDITDTHNTADPVAVGLNATAYARTTTIIDGWSLVHSVREIVDGKPVKILTRTLKYLDTITS